MLTRHRRADLSRYEIVGILRDKGLSVREIAEVCRLSPSWTYTLLRRLGYECVWYGWVWRKKRDYWVRRHKNRHAPVA